MKKTLVSLILALSILMGCTGIAGASEDMGRVLATFEGTPIYEAELLGLMSDYYMNGYIESDTEYLAALEYLIYHELVIEQKASDMGFDQFTDEERKQIETDAQMAFVEYVEYMVDTMISSGAAEDTEESRVEIRRMAIQYLEENESSLDAFIEASLKNEARSRLLNSVEEATVTQDEIMATFQENLDKDYELFKDDIRSYEFYLYYGGYDIWYTPEGFRNILQIVIQPNKDVLDAYNIARRSVIATDEEKAAAHAAVLADCKELTDEIYARLEAGEKFEALIAEYDTSTETLGKTIDMPIMVNTTSVYWNDGVINAAFDAQMTEPGCYSQPYADKAGVHIAYYVSDVPSGFAEYTDEIGAAIKQYLVSVKREETIFGWADEYEIVINNDEIDAMIAQIEAEALAAEEAEIAAIQAYAEQVEKERAEAAKNKD